MKTKRKILISLIVIAILGYAVVINDKDSATYNNTSSLPQSQSFEFNNSFPHHTPQGTSELNRDEVLKKSLKGYRFGSNQIIVEPFCFIHKANLMHY